MRIPGRAPDTRRIAVLGPGAVGGFLAALLWRAGHSVTCVTREGVAEIIDRDGLRLESAALGDFVARPRAVTSLREPAEVLFVTTKAHGLAAALERVPPAPGGMVVPLLNGVEHLAPLRAHFGPRVIAGSIGGLQVWRQAVNHVVHASRSAHIELASNGEVPAARVAELAGLIAACGIAAEVLASEAQVLWHKLVRLNALACTTAASGRALGFVRADPAWRARLESCVREAAAVATAEGAPTEAAAVLAEIDAMPDALTTSLARDVAVGRPSEIDAIAGAVVRAGERHGLRCPAIAELWARIARGPEFIPCPPP